MLLKGFFFSFLATAGNSQNLWKYLLSILLTAVVTHVKCLLCIFQGFPTYPEHSWSRLPWDILVLLVLRGRWFSFALAHEGTECQTGPAACTS